MVLLEVLASAPQYRQLAAVMLACTLAVVLSRLYRSASSRGKQREYVFPGVAPGPDGYRKGQQRYLTECAAMIREGIQMVCTYRRSPVFLRCVLTPNPAGREHGVLGSEHGGTGDGGAPKVPAGDQEPPGSELRGVPARSALRRSDRRRRPLLVAAVRAGHQEEPDAVALARHRRAVGGSCGGAGPPAAVDRR